MRLTLLTTAVAAPLLAACAAVQPAPVPLVGPSAPLAGEWRGSYESPATGRAGSILLTLAAGEDHAHGDVVMVPRGQTASLRPADRMGGPEPDGTARPLAIEFIRVSGDAVFGTMAPYVDPDCRCTALTTFEGRISGDIIRGTFSMRHANEAGTVHGTWSVRRAR